LIFEAALLGAALLLGRWLETPAFRQLQVDPWGVALGLFAAAPLYLALQWCLRTRWPPLARLTRLATERLAPLFSGYSPAHLALIAALAGLAEEALFRGVIQVALAEHMSEWAAVGAAGVLFGLAHAISPTYAMAAGVVGVYLGAIFLLSGNLLVSVVAHGAYDLVALRILVRLKPSASY